MGRSFPRRKGAWDTPCGKRRPTARRALVDLVPKDIILCDWHYAKLTNYPSVPFLLKKGFRVWPSGWQPLEAAVAFSAFARQQKNPRLLGYLATTWGKVKIPDATQWRPIRETMRQWQ